MQQEKLHRKRAYSQKVLKEALLKLLVDQPLSKITVQKLCETADVNRTTFYSNFEDIFALYRQVGRFSRTDGTVYPTAETLCGQPCTDL